MKTYNRLIALSIVLISAAFIAANIFMNRGTSEYDRSYRVEVNRLVKAIENGEEFDPDDYEQLTGVFKDDGSGSLYDCNKEYVIKEIGGTLYRIEYDRKADSDRDKRIAVNAVLAVFSAATLAVLIYLRQKVVKPFNKLEKYPIELSKGNLTSPLKEDKSKHFGKFVWGLDMLRGKLEDTRKKEYEHAKKEKTMLLSLSHDIKTPLAAIKLSSQALSKGIYTDKDKQMQVAKSISANADEIEKYVGEIIRKTENDFLSYEINMGQVYLSQAMNELGEYYSEKLAMLGTEFSIGQYSDCLLSADAERLQEVFQNIIENAIKYGDGRRIEITFSEEEECRLITVTNTGCTLPEGELDDIFSSFHRGSNVGSNPGSGLGLYICRRLMNDMGGDVFAEIDGDLMRMTVVCKKA